MSVTLRLLLFVFATYVLCLHGARTQSYSGSEELPQITMAVVVDTIFVSMSSKHMSMSVQNYLLLAKRNHLKHVDLQVLSYSTTDADIDKDVTAVVSVSPCSGAWKLHQSLQDHAVLHLAVTDKNSDAFLFQACS
uniref:(California timema) hypothetical protein n=1 Tax=Timema californicum TaxID=61474 RepID=A0A7R9PAF6_TIMCA|nr:unnamed protein product [Timema californicum]